MENGSTFIRWIFGGKSEKLYGSGCRSNRKHQWSKTVTQNEDGSFSFAARVNNGTDSGIKDAALKQQRILQQR